MKFLVVLLCVLVAVSAVPYRDRGFEGRRRPRPRPRPNNVANQISNSRAGGNGVAVSSGDAAAGLNSGGRGNNFANQKSNAEAGFNGVANSQGSATAGREKRAVIVGPKFTVNNGGSSDDGAVAPVYRVEAPVKAKQKSIAVTGNGPAVASGSAVATKVKREVSSLGLSHVSSSGSGSVKGSVLTDKDTNSVQQESVAVASGARGGAAVAQGSVST